MAIRRSGTHNNRKGGPDSGDAKSVILGEHEPDWNKIAEKHLDGLSKLFAIPLPIILTIMVALTTLKPEDVINVGPLAIPQSYSEYTARVLLLIVFAQLSAHFLALLTISKRSPDTDSLWRSLAFHPGPLNPFFGTVWDAEGKSDINRFFRFTLFPGRMTQLAIGLVVGFTATFRPGYSFGIVALWYRLGSWIVWPFSQRLHSDLVKAADQTVQYYIAASSRWGNLFDTIYALMMLLTGLGICAAIVSITNRTGGETRAGGAL